VTVIPCSEVKMLIRDLFEEEALALGGLVAVYEIEDDLVWPLIRTLAVTRRRVLRRLAAGRSEDNRRTRRPASKPHPAIEEFLIRLREEGK